jgi:hypothetical protein
MLTFVCLAKTPSFAFEERRTDQRVHRPVAAVFFLCRSLLEPGRCYRVARVHQHGVVVLRRDFF